MAKTATTVFPPDSARDELAIVVISGSVAVSICTLAMNGGEVPTIDSGNWVAVPEADPITESKVLYRGRDAYVRIVPEAGAVFDIA